MTDKITLNQMEEFGLHQLCVDLCKNIINSQVSDGSELRYLLPVKYIISNWNVFDSVEWKNPITGEEFVEPFENETERINAILEINKRIEDYNAKVEELDSEYDDLEEKVKNQTFRQRDLYQLWTLTAWMHNPVHGQLPEMRQKTPFDARYFNSEPVYKKLLTCTTPEEGVEKFNKMLYEYVNAVTEGKQLIETSTFYYPKMEFDDYMMRGGYAEFINLLEEDEEAVNQNNVPLIITPFATITSESIWAELPEEVKKDMLPSYLHSPPPNIPQDYCITLDLENKMFEVEHVEYRAKEKASFSELGFENRNGKPNRLLALLIRYAYFKKETEGKPFLDKSEQWKQLVQGEYSMNTIHKYHKGLSKALTKLLCLSTLKREDGSYPPEGTRIYSREGNLIVEKCFIRNTDTLEQRNTRGEVETITLTYHDCLIELKLKDAPQLRETGYSAEGLEQYSAELDSEGNLIGQ